MGVAVGGASIGIPGVAVGRQNTDKVTGKDVKRVLSKEQIQSLLDELGNPPLKRGKAEVSTESFGPNQVSVIVIPTQVGSLTYFQSDNGIEQAFFFFGSPKKNGKIPPGFLKRLPEEYRDLPAAGKGVLALGPNGEPILNRGPSGPQGVSTNELGVAQVDDLPDIVERFNVYPPVSIGMINGCDVVTGYTHKHTKFSFELTDPADTFSKNLLIDIVSTLAGSVLVGSIAGAVLGFVLGTVVGAIVAFGTGTEYTVGFRDDDLDYLIGKTGQIVAAAANEYDAPVENTVYAGSAPGFHLFEGRV